MNDERQFKDDIDYLVEQFARGKENTELSTEERTQTLTGIFDQILNVTAESEQINTLAGKRFAYKAVDRCLRLIPQADPGRHDVDRKATKTVTNICYYEDGLKLV